MDNFGELFKASGLINNIMSLKATLEDTQEILQLPKFQDFKNLDDSRLEATLSSSATVEKVKEIYEIASALSGIAANLELEANKTAWGIKNLLKKYEGGVKNDTNE